MKKIKIKLKSQLLTHGKNKLPKSMKYVCMILHILMSILMHWKKNNFLFSQGIFSMCLWWRQPKNLKYLA